MFNKLLALIAIEILVFIPFFPIFASTKTDLEEMIVRRNQEIEELQKQIDGYNQDLDKNKTKVVNIQGEIVRLAAEIKRSELEIKSLSLAIEGIGFEIEKTGEQIKEINSKIDNTKADLIIALRALGQSEKSNSIELIITKPTISSMITELYDLYFLQSSIKRRMVDLRETKQTLQDIEGELAIDLKEREELKALEELNKAQVARKRNEQKNLLSQVEKEKSKIINKIKIVEIDLSRIKEQISFLVKTGISVEDAIRYGQLAAIRLGIRPAFLIAVLEVESRLGLNVGKGNWQNDMHQRDQDAFLAICSKLNLDPDQTPVSKKPRYGWGGAMGPAQFLPNTWLAYEGEIARLTNHQPPSPWNIEDAFTAAAIKLSRQGASSKTRRGEVAAAKAYIGGSSSCSRAICQSYANTVLDKAEELEKELGS